MTALRMEFASRRNARALLAGLDVTVALEFAPQSAPAMASSLDSCILASVFQVFLAETASSKQRRKYPARKHAKTESVTTTRSAFVNLDSVEKTAIRKHV